MPLRHVAEVYRIGWFIVQAFSWSGIQAVLNKGDLDCCDLCERHFLREVLTNQTVGVFVCSTFPTVVRLGEETLATECCGNLFVAGELLAVVECDGFYDLAFEQTQDFGGDIVGKFRFRIADQYTSANPLQECHQIARRIGSANKISLPIAKPKAASFLPEARKVS